MDNMQPADIEDAVLIVWGHGPSTVAAIRDADEDLAYAAGLRDNRGRRVADVLAEHDDAWCVALTIDEIDTTDLDADPAVLGYCECSTNG